jgi:hypothetical protein
VRFAYRGRDGAESRRDVEPNALVPLGRRWYLVAWDRGRQGWRSFRVDRIAAPGPAGGRVEPRALPAADAAAFVTESMAAAPRVHEARLTLGAPAEAVRARAPAGWGTVTPIDEASCEYRTGDDDLDWLALRVLMLGADFELHEPPELAERLRELSARVERGTAAPVPAVRVLVDAMNVVGARPDGWWRDREGALGRLRDAVDAYARASGEEVVLVAEGPGTADDEIVRLVEADPAPGRVRVVTSDRALAARVRRLGAAVEGAGAFRRRLEAAGRAGG